MYRKRERTIGLMAGLALSAAIGTVSGHILEWCLQPANAAEADRPDFQLGAPVVSSDGRLVGRVEWISKDFVDHISRIRFSRPRELGIGEKVLTLRGDAFMVRDGVVHLTVSAAAVDALPEAMPRDDAAAFVAESPRAD